MKVVEILAERHKNWAELQSLCMTMNGRSRKRMPPETIVRFATLYRAACADLALADAYHLPPNTVEFLHQLVAQSHNLLYRSRTLQVQSWFRVLFLVVPQKIFQDKYVWVSGLLFYGLFMASFYLAARDPRYAESKVGKETLQAMEFSYREAPADVNPFSGAARQSFYVQHNTGIGLRCFAAGLLFGMGGMFEIVFEAIFLGAIFGYMSTTSEVTRDNFFTFVMAHGPFELTAIVLSGAAGMRLGFALVFTGGLTRMASLRRTAWDAMPIMGATMLLFIGAAFIEGFVSHAPVPHAAKAAVSATCCGLLVFYFVVLGMPNVSFRRKPPETGDGSWEAAVKSA